MNNKNKKIFFSISFMSAIFFAAILFFGFNKIVLAADSLSYTPMEEIPGFGRPQSLPAYIKAVYQFGLWGIGISALLMIMIGGYMYLTSAGNNASMERAKKIIWDAIAGIVLAMVSYLLLYIINPDLVKIKLTKINQAQDKFLVYEQNK
jgi:hypothetical protein